MKFVAERLKEFGDSLPPEVLESDYLNAFVGAKQRYCQ
jgi:hypothetical protein